VSYIYGLKYLFEYLKDPDMHYTRGIWLCAIYAVAIFVSTFLRNYYIFVGHFMGVAFRKAVVSTMYDKVG